MLQAQLKAIHQAKEGDVGGDISHGVNGLTSRNPDVSGSVTCAVRGGSGGAAGERDRRSEPCQTQPIEFWHDLFRYINRTIPGGYPWRNSDRKIAANAARKYGVPALMAMWDFYTPGYGFRDQENARGLIYRMVRNSQRCFEWREFKRREKLHTERLLAQYGIWDAVLNSGEQK